MPNRWCLRLIALLLNDAVLLSLSRSTTEKSIYGTRAYNDAEDFDDDHGVNDFNVSSYDIYEERCCEGKTYPKSTNGQYSCCGSSDYDTTREICCDEKVYPQQLGYECCGENYINTNYEICCYNPSYGMAARSLPAGDPDANETRLFTRCCGDELYDTRSYLCFLATYRFSGLANFTVIENKYNRTGCCDGQPYDEDVDRCAYRSLTYTRLSRPSDFFKQVYDRVKKWNQLKNSPSTHSWSRPDYLGGYNHRHHVFQRCRDQAYDPTSQLCCGDRYFEEENGIVKIWNETRGDSSCCGTDKYIYSTHYCCNGRIVERQYGLDRCCGQDLYNRERQWCCEGSNTVIDAQPRKGERCCGPEGLVFNTSAHVCCNNRLVELPERDNGHLNRRWQCCPSNDLTQPDQIYDYYKAKCCNGIVRNFTADPWWRYDCCGNELYDIRRSTCCGGKIYNSSSCCVNKETYNPRTHKCCDGTVVEMPSPGTNSCCGKTPYDRAQQTCCFHPHTKTWQVTIKKNQYERCCGGAPYAPDKQSCCGASIVIDEERSLCCDGYDPETGSYSYAAVEKKTPFSSCCGLTAYDRENEICCNGTPFSNEGKNMTCCGSNSYNNATQLCCRGEVYARSDDGNRRCCGKHAYEMTKEICCRGVAFSVNDVNTAKCCYGKPQKQS